MENKELEKEIREIAEYLGCNEGELVFEVMKLISSHQNKVLASIQEEIGEDEVPKFKMESQLEYASEMLRFYGKNEEKARFRRILSSHYHLMK